MEEKTCKSCGFAISDTQKFCQECGAKIEHAQFCKECGTRLGENAKFCFECGTPAVKKEAEEKPKKPAKKKSKKPFVLDLIKKSLALFVALFMLACAFLPIMTYEVDFGDEDFEVNFSAFDGVIMLVNSLYSNDEEETLEELEELYAEIEDLAAEYSSDWRDGEELDRIAPYIKKTVNILYRSEMTDATTGIVLVALLCVAYVVMAIVLTVIASLSFASAFKKSMKNRTGLVTLLVGIQAVLALVTAFAYNTIHGGSSSFSMEGFTLGIEDKCSSLQIWAFVLGILLFVAYGVIRLCIEKRTKVKASTIVKYALCLVFAFALLFSTLAPVVTTEVKAKFNQGEEKRANGTIHAGVFFAFEVSESAKDELDDLSDEEKTSSIKSYIDILSMYTKRQFENGKAEEFDKQIYANLLLDFGAYRIGGLFALGGVAIILAFASACVVIWQYLAEIATGKRARKAITATAKVVAIIMTVIAIALLVVTLLVVNNNAEVIKVSYETKIAYGPILMLIFAIGMACVPSVKIKGEEQQGIKEAKQEEIQTEDAPAQEAIKAEAQEPMA